MTNGGGRRAVWSADGREIFFDRDGQIHAVRVLSTSPLAFGAPTPLPITDFVQGGARRQWDVLPDGRLLMMFPASQ